MLTHDIDMIFVLVHDYDCLLYHDDICIYYDLMIIAVSAHDFGIAPLNAHMMFDFANDLRISCW